MFRTLSLAAGLCAAATFVATDIAAAQTPYPTQTYRTRQVAANGRCNGVSYGTGARRCGSRTGGPAGGISSRN